MILIFDMAGTTVDHGCMAPVDVFLEVFARRGVTDLTVDEVRGPMGTHKRDHIRALTRLPRLAGRFTEADVEAMYVEAEPIQAAMAARHGAPIDGVPETMALLRAGGARIGATSGYNRHVLDAALAVCQPLGWTPDVTVAVDEVPLGRPAPHLAWRAAMLLGAGAAAACVHVGDTVVDVQAGKRAGFFSVGVARTGNLVGLDAAALAALTEEERAARVARAREVLRDAGADAVIDAVTDLPALLAAR